jgi:hypothetical protein
MKRDDSSTGWALHKIIPNQGPETPVTVSAKVIDALRSLGQIENASELGVNTWRPTGSADANRIRDWLGKEEWERQVLDGEVPMLYVEHRDKPANAAYLAQATLQADGWGKMTPGQYGWGGTVKITWYEDRVKITLPGSTPAAITQAYLTGHDNDVIVELSKAGPTRNEKRLEEISESLKELEKERKEG